MATILSYALCSLADVKETLVIPSSVTTYDNLITRKINQATEMIEGYCDRRFKAADYTEYYDGSHTDQLVLRNFPINSIASLGARDTSLNDDSFDSIPTDQFFSDAQGGVLEAISSFYGGYDRWKIVYNAGYATIPSDLAEACATLAAFLYNNDASQVSGISSKKEGGREIHYSDNKVQYGGSDPTNIITQLGLQVTLDRYSEPVVSGQR